MALRKYDSEKIIALYKKGLSENKIGTEIGASHSVIRRYLKRNNIPIRETPLSLLSKNVYNSVIKHKKYSLL